MASDEDDKKTPFGRSGAAGEGAKGDDDGKNKTAIDKPSTPDEDFATDERRKKSIRGDEDWQE